MRTNFLRNKEISGNAMRETGLAAKDSLSLHAMTSPAAPQPSADNR